MKSYGHFSFKVTVLGRHEGKIWKDCKVWSSFQFYFYFRLNIINSSGLHNADNRFVHCFCVRNLNYCWQPNVKIEAWVGCQRTYTKRVWECGRGYIGILMYINGLRHCLGCAHLPFLRDAAPCAWEWLRLCHWKDSGVLDVQMVFLSCVKGDFFKN